MNHPSIHLRYNMCCLEIKLVLILMESLQKGMGYVKELHTFQQDDIILPEIILVS